nr:hypothetical protein CFP56_12963 [Quercus suber]
MSSMPPALFSPKACRCFCMQYNHTKCCRGAAGGQHPGCEHCPLLGRIIRSTAAGPNTLYPFPRPSSGWDLTTPGINARDVRQRHPLGKSLVPTRDSCMAVHLTKRKHAASASMKIFPPTVLLTWAPDGLALAEDRGTSRKK